MHCVLVQKLLFARQLETDTKGESVFYVVDNFFKEKDIPLSKDFWLQKEISDCYPVLWNKVKIYFIAFPTSYLIERGFSAVTLLLSMQRNRLKITERGDLRLLLSEF